MSDKSQTEILINIKYKQQKRSRTSFMLDQKEYSKLKKFCASKNITPSDLINALIIDFNDRCKDE